MSAVTTNSVVDFLNNKGGGATYKELKHKFSFYLNDSVKGDENKQQFKEILKQISTVTQKNGERWITLKEKWLKSISPGPPIIPENVTGQHSTISQSLPPRTIGQTESSDEKLGSSLCASSTTVSDDSHKLWLSAISKGDVHSMKALLGEKSELIGDADMCLGYTAYHWAALTGNCDMIDFLVSHTDQASAINKLDHSGHTPLHVAYIHNRLPAAHLLEKSGADKFADDFDCRLPDQLGRLSLARIKPQGQADFFSVGSTPKEHSSFAGKIASKIRDKVRSISTSNSSVESICSSSSSHSSYCRKGISSFDRANRYQSDRSFKHHSNATRFTRALSNSSGAINLSSHFPPNLAASYSPFSRSQEMSPLNERRSPTKSNVVSRV